MAEVTHSTFPGWIRAFPTNDKPSRRAQPDAFKEIQAAVGVAIDIQGQSPNTSVFPPPESILVGTPAAAKNEV